jgi:hypothetical protein
MDGFQQLGLCPVLGDDGNRTGGEQLLRGQSALLRRQHDDLGPRHRRPELPDPLDRRSVRHVQIEHEHTRTVAVGELDRRRQIRCFVDHAHALPDIQQAA